jgi:hypothetical protein
MYDVKSWSAFWRERAGADMVSAERLFSSRTKIKEQKKKKQARSLVVLVVATVSRRRNRVGDAIP